MKEESGQTIIILLLIVVVALGIGLAVVGRSITEISTSTKTEESTRAFSAAEAGIEKALQQSSGQIGVGAAGSLGGSQIPLTNQAQTQVNWNPSLPESDCGAGIGCPLEYPEFGKESFAQFWLAHPINTSGGFPQLVYAQNSFEVYFGKSDETYTDAYYALHPEVKPAIEVAIIYRDGDGYNSVRNFYDSYSVGATSARNNSFQGCSQLVSTSPTKTNQSTSDNRYFYCRVVVDFSLAVDSTHYPVMVRIRMLYSDISHPVALKPTAGFLPAQVSVITSTGSAGTTQRTLQVFQQKAVMPNLFDFVLFSAGTLNKP